MIRHQELVAISRSFPRAGRLRRAVTRANLHKQQPATPHVICLPDDTPEGKLLRRLDILGRKLTHEGLYMRSWAVLDAIMMIEQLTGRSANRPGWCT